MREGSECWIGYSMTAPSGVKTDEYLGNDIAPRRDTAGAGDPREQRRGRPPRAPRR